MPSEEPDTLKHLPPGTRLRQQIVESIQSGKLKPGDTILPIGELSQRYGMARRTAHKCIQKLVKDGYLQTFRGRGTFVRELEPQSNRATSVLLRNPHHHLVTEGLRHIADLFNDAQSEINVIITHDDGPSTMPEVFVASALGQMPPAFRIDSFRGSSEVLAGLHPRLQKEDALGIGEPNTFVPFAWYSHGLAINRSLPETVDRPAPVHWDELIRWAKERPPTLEHASYMIVRSLELANVYLPYYWMLGEDLYVHDKQALLMTHDGLSQWFSFLGSIRQHCKALPNSVPIEPVLEGGYLFNFVCGPWLIQQRRQLDTATAVSIHEPPTPNANATPAALLSMLMMGITRKEMNESEKAACWTVIRHFLSMPVQSMIAERIGMLPVLNALWSGWDSDPERGVWNRMLNHSRLLPIDPINKQLRGALAVEFYNFLLDPQDPARAADNFLRTANGIVALNG